MSGSISQSISRRDGNKTFFAMQKGYPESNNNSNKRTAANALPSVPPFAQSNISNARKPNQLVHFDNIWTQDIQLPSGTTGYPLVSSGNTSVTVNNFNEDGSLFFSGMILDPQHGFYYVPKIEEDLNSVPIFDESVPQGVEPEVTPRSLAFGSQQVTVPSNDFNGVAEQLNVKNEPFMDIVVSRRTQPVWQARPRPQYNNTNIFTTNLGASIYATNQISTSFAESLPSSPDDDQSLSPQSEAHSEIEGPTNGDYGRSPGGNSNGTQNAMAQPSTANGGRDPNGGRNQNGATDNPDDLLPRDENGRQIPYARLLEKAFLSVPSRSMVLSQVYEWFTTNYPRYKTAASSGWRNSIRHNLSMNGGFEKHARPEGDPGKGHIWVLTEKAEREGVKSTTRFRQKSGNKRPAKTISKTQTQRKGGNSNARGCNNNNRSAKKPKAAAPMTTRITRSNIIDNYQLAADTHVSAPPALMRSYSSTGETSPESTFPPTPDQYTSVGFETGNGVFMNNSQPFFSQTTAPGYERNVNIVPSQHDYQEVDHTWNYTGKWV